MVYRVPPCDPTAPVIVVDIGNTATGIATWHREQLSTPLSVPTEDQAAFNDALAAHVEASRSRGQTRRGHARGSNATHARAGTSAAGSGPYSLSMPPVVIGSVVPAALERICTHLLAASERKPLIVGETIPLPIDVAVTDAKAIGVDRVCAAAAAYEKLQTGCTIVDFGTAVTVDLVDDEGTLRGGAILPGLKMQLRALHEHTAALPEVEPAMPELPYGRNTVEAMQTGVCRGLAGAVRALIEAYATSLNRWPQVVATGGDLSFIAPHCDFLDTLAQDLTLRGIGLAYTKYMTAMGA